MKTNIYVFLRYHLFEYKALETYLEEMSEKGWMLCERLAMFDDIFRFEKAQKQKRKFHVVLNPQVNKINKGYNKEKQKEYIDFVQSYGYHYICGDYDILIFYSDDVNVIEINEDNKETKDEIRKYTWINELLNPIWYTAVVTLWIYILIFQNSSWIYMNAIKFITFLVLFMYIITTISRACIASMHLIFHKNISHIDKIKRRSKATLCMYAIFEIALFMFLFYQQWWYGIVFVISQLIVMYSIKKVWKFRSISRELIGLVLLAVVYVLLLLYSSVSQAQQLPISEIPFRSSQLQDVNIDTTLAFLEKEEHLFLTSYQVQETYYDEVGGGIYDKEHQFSYTYTILKDTPLKQRVKDTLLSEFDDYHMEYVNGIKVYDAGDFQFLIKNDIMLMIESRIPLNDVNIQLFETVFFLGSKGEHK